MSREYDEYLQQHKANVKKGYDWIKDNLPELIPDGRRLDLEHQIGFAHDYSKSQPDEYEPYDAYFYGGNRSYQVVRDYEYAWLLHIHRNPHHWQHWVLIHDDPDEAETILDMPYEYILEMICDWWAFSWSKENLYEIFNWYDDHRNYMKLSDKTRKTVDDILGKMHDKLDEEGIQHSGVKGMKWGVKNGPPYPINRLKNAAGKDILIVERTELKGPPNGITQITHKNGGIERNYYDDNGRQIKQISNNNHGKPKQHSYGIHGEHAHDYTYDEDGYVHRSIRELTDDERKENGDIL